MLWPVIRAVNSVMTDGADLLDRIDDPAAPPPSNAVPGGIAVSQAAAAAAALTPAMGGTPQDSALTRGFLRVDAASGSKLLLLATIRQVFNNLSAAGMLLDQAEGAYAVPLVGGPEHSF